jgi:glycine dehydrogenase
MRLENVISESKFVDRHIGPRQEEVDAMLKVVGRSSITDLVDKTIPKSIQLTRALNLPEAASESVALGEMKSIASKNEVYRSYIGQGYYSCHIPSVIRRNILENPGWYTQYTPYQAEISQGRLEALFNYQTVCSELTELPIANASLLDEGTAAAEAMMISYQAHGSDQKSVFLVAENCHPQTIAVVKTRARDLGIEVAVVPFGTSASAQVFGCLAQSPDTNGNVLDCSKWFADVKAHEAAAVLATDPLFLVLGKSAGAQKADVAVGSMQRFGVPLGFGGPHAAFLCTTDEHKRRIPGRIVGRSLDVNGQPGLRLALQTREQHIRREKASSNICTSQVLLAIMSSMYCVYHGPKGLRKIASRVAWFTQSIAQDLKKSGVEIGNDSSFDTVSVKIASAERSKVQARCAEKKINLRWHANQDLASFSVDETVGVQDAQDIFYVLTGKSSANFNDAPSSFAPNWSATRANLFSQKVFNSHHSETMLQRYIRTLESRDLSLTHSMIPLGSCTMKLNAASELYPISFEGIANLHPYAPKEQTAGYQKLTNDLESWLAEITGFDAVSLQPNSGAQGEYAGLLAVKRFHESRGERREICLIPKSAHGTNPASATLAGLKVEAVNCDSSGNIDIEHLRARVMEFGKRVSVIMITYPSTHGVFEEGIAEACAIVHSVGGMVYLDGANMNAQVGICRPGDYGADVCHLNLHKTFCIPHGGGGPGMGPIGVKSHLKPFLPSDPTASTPSGGCGPVSAANFGSASILPISWMYIRMMGPDGLRRASEIAILNANYIAKRLGDHYSLLYKGVNGHVAHECIVDMKSFRQSAAVEVEDVAKRLMDYGFHAPTISFPVPFTVMIEPTESEDKAELDRFCDAMISIRQEIAAIEKTGNKTDNLLKNAPHTAAAITSDEWVRPYTRQQAAFPLPWIKDRKFWPHVSRIDGAYGDRNLVCTCEPMA